MNWPRARSSATASGRTGPPAAGRLVLFLALCLASAGLPGCGGALATCPTPTSDIDRHREESLAAERDTRAALSEERALRAEREQAAARIGAAQAALDSLKTAAGTE